jgi:hypothetical protein
MLIQGNGIQNITFQTDREIDYKPNLGLEWFKLSDGNYTATDWGELSDVYETKIFTFGKEDYINNIISSVNDLRTSGVYTLYLSEFADDEFIFGENFDYSNVVSATPIAYELKESTSWKGYQFGMTLRCQQPSFRNDITEFEWSNVCINHKWVGDRTWDMNVYDSYNSVLSVYDHIADEGMCEVTFNFDNNQVASLLEFQRVNRAETFVLPLGAFGVEYPFGVKSSKGPHNVKLYEIEVKRFSPIRSLVDCKLVEIR